MSSLILFTVLFYSMGVTKLTGAKTRTLTELDYSGVLLLALLAIQQEGAWLKTRYTEGSFVFRELFCSSC